MFKWVTEQSETFHDGTKVRVKIKVLVQQAVQ